MILNEQGGILHDLNERRPRPAATRPQGYTRSRTIVVRHGSTWPALAFVFLCGVLAAIVLMGHRVVRGLDARDEESSAAMARVERKLQQLESGIAFDSQRRQLLLGMRNEILKTSPRVTLAEAYEYARLALEACEKYPALDPLLLLAVGVVESGYDPLARSPADARGLYQIWPSTGRLLARALGWNYDEATLYDPVKNTEAAALYLDILFATYADPQMVLAEYNGGPVNAGFFRAGARALAEETKNYVPRVLALHARLKDEFAKGIDVHVELQQRDGQRQARTLGAAAAAGR
ncbi:MAG TPA: transglycosylase SLT domain-containing protein [Vicinamibacteria bacterium]|nr:transglycosylase SLT domain-containing protein [Vicinamibacteria bacterium]